MPLGRIASLAVRVVATVLIAASGLEAQPTSMTVTAAADTVTEGGSITFTIMLDAPVTQARTLSLVLVVSENFPIFKSASHFVDPNAAIVFEADPITNFLDPASNKYQMNPGATSHRLTIPTVDDGVAEPLEVIALFGALLEDTGVGMGHDPPQVCVIDNDGGSVACPGAPPPSLDIIDVEAFLESAVVGQPVLFSLRRSPQGEILELPVNAMIEADPETLVDSDDRGAKVYTFRRGSTLERIRVPTDPDSPAITAGLVRVTVLPGDGYEVGENSSAEVPIGDDRDAPPPGGGDEGDDDGGDEGDDDGGDEGDDGGGDEGDDEASFVVHGAECDQELCVTRVGVRLTAIDRTRNVVERRWTTSDGQTGSGQRFRPVWRSPGEYDLSLTVKWTDGSTDTKSRRVSVRGDEGDDEASFVVHGAECGPEFCVARVGEGLTAENPTRNVMERRWTTSDGQAGSGRRFRPVWRLPGYYVLSLTVKAPDGSTDTKSRRVFVGVSDPLGDCAPAAQRHCLLDQRYLVEVELTAADGGEPRSARNAYEGTNDSGLFWFFDESNWEVLVKVLDGCQANGHHWVFAASTTDLGYVIKVTDTLTDREATYSNEAGNRAAAVTDVQAFPDACR